MFLRTNDGSVADKRFKFVFICWVTTVTWTDIRVAQFKTFGTAAAAIAVWNVASRTLFDLLGPS